MRISIIVATYKTAEEHLQKLIASLDAQTLDGSEYELILADDGSGAETLERLHRIADSRGNTRVLELENSGWACRPRNEGLAVARGDYVLFMDHDDLLFPEGLARVVEFADTGDYDVINPREVRTKHWTWAWDAFDAEPDPAASIAELLMPMTPHKFYRRTFLQENGIEFIAKRRVLWEDVFFNTACVAAAARVGVLRDYPVYHWVTHDSNTSSGFGRDRNEVWSTIRQLLAAFADLPTDSRDYLIRHWLRTRVLDIPGPKLLKAGPERRRIDLENSKAVAAEYAADVEHLGTIQRARAAALEADDLDRLTALAELEVGFTPATRVESVRWHGDTVEVKTVTTFKFREVDLEIRLDADGRPEVRLPYATADGAQWIGLDLFDRPDDVAITVRGRSDRQTWPIGTGRIVLETTGDEPLLIGRATAHWNIRRFMQQIPNWRQPWDLAVRVAVPLRTSHRQLVGTATTVKAGNAVIDGQSAVGYVNASGGVTVDLGGTVKNALRKRVQRPIAVRRGSGDAVVRLPLASLNVVGTEASNLTARLADAETPGYDRIVPAALVAGAEGNWIELKVPTEARMLWNVSVQFARSWVDVGQVRVGPRSRQSLLRAVRNRAARLVRRLNSR